MKAFTPPNPSQMRQADETGRFTLTAAQRGEVDEARREWCARVWEQASDEMREQLARADWFVR